MFVIGFLTLACTTDIQ